MEFSPPLIGRAQHDNTLVKPAVASVFALILLVGVFLRLYHVERAFWGDESATAHFVAGYGEADILNAFRNVGVLTAAQLYQFEVVSDARGPSDTIRALAIEDAGHPPLYYVLGHEWLRAVGGSPTRLRLLTALLSLLLLPAVYWLSAELFESRTTAYIAVAIVAVSPFWVQYAQQAREYVLWAALTSASCASLLRALRTNSAGSWALYCLSLVLSLYCFLFAVFVVLAHVAFVCITYRFRVSSPPFIPFLFSIVGAFAIFAPWLITAFIYMRSGIYSYDNALPLHGLIYVWMQNLTVPFFDLEYIDARFFLIVLGVIALIAWSFASLLRFSTQRTIVFVACLAIAPLLVYASKNIIPDATRYAVPTLLSVQLTVAFAISRLLNERGRSNKMLGTAFFAAFIALGTASCIVRSQQQTWGLTQYGAAFQPIANEVNRAVHPRVVTDDWVIALDISRLLNPSARIELAGAHASPGVDLGKETVFLYSRSAALANQYALKYDVVPVPVTVPRRGWAIYSDMLHHRGNGSQGRTTETWLWRVVPAKRTVASP